MQRENSGLNKDMPIAAEIQEWQLNLSLDLTTWSSLVTWTLAVSVNGKDNLWWQRIREIH